jgi:hypothetical protein
MTVTNIAVVVAAAAIVQSAGVGVRVLISAHRRLAKANAVKEGKEREVVNDKK